MRLKGQIYLIAMFLFFALSTESYSQCSDAGVCTLGSHKQNEEKEAHSNSSISLNDRVGYSGKDDDITYNSVILSGSFGLSRNISANFSLPYNFQSGQVGDFNGLGDLIIGFSFNHILNKESSIDIKAGGKFATGDANLGNAFYYGSAPLAYQSGSGTNDILLGVTYNNMGFAATLGGQIPLDRSKNEFSQLKRGADLLLGLGYTFTAAKNFYVTGEVITIKRLSESNAIFLGAEYDIPDSDFLQMNIQLSANYLIHRNVGLNLSGAVPLLKRETNVDGTKRAFTVSAGASYYFNMSL